MYSNVYLSSTHIVSRVMSPVSRAITQHPDGLEAARPALLVAAPRDGVGVRRPAQVDRRGREHEAAGAHRPRPARPVHGELHHPGLAQAEGDELWAGPRPRHPQLLLARAEVPGGEDGVSAVGGEGEVLAPATAHPRQQLLRPGTRKQIFIQY